MVIEQLWLPGCEIKPEVSIGMTARGVFKDVVRRNLEIAKIDLFVVPDVQGKEEQKTKLFLKTGQRPTIWDIEVFDYPDADSAETYTVARDGLLSPHNALEQRIIYSGCYDWREISELLRVDRPEDHYWTKFIWGEERSEIRSNRFVAVSSKVKLVGEREREAYIPVMDYGCLVSPENQRRVVEDVQNRQQQGYILDSGGSYHFLGRRLMTKDQWQEFLNGYMGNPLVDSKFIKFAQRLGYGSLRISHRNRSAAWIFHEGTDAAVRKVWPERLVPRVVAFVE